jgi:hypothetical protein
VHIALPAGFPAIPPRITLQALAPDAAARALAPGRVGLAHGPRAFAAGVRALVLAGLGVRDPHRI